MKTTIILTAFALIFMTSMVSCDDEARKAGGSFTVDGVSYGVDAASFSPYYKSSGTKFILLHTAGLPNVVPVNQGTGNLILIELYGTSKEIPVGETEEDEIGEFTLGGIRAYMNRNFETGEGEATSGPENMELEIKKINEKIYEVNFSFDHDTGSCEGSFYGPIVNKVN